jgi:hypothetical protein
MLEKSREYLRLAVAAAAILIGLSVAYHYVIYIPQRDTAEKLDAQTKAVTEAAQAQVKQAALAKASLDRRANYRVCMSNAQMNYSVRWNGLCRKRSEQADKNRLQCIQGGSTEETCETYYPQMPVNDCLLPHETSDSFDAGLKEDQKQCLDEARAGILDSPDDANTAG